MNKTFNRKGLVAVHFPTFWFVIGECENTKYWISVAIQNKQIYNNKLCSAWLPFKKKLQNIHSISTLFDSSQLSIWKHCSAEMCKESQQYHSEMVGAYVWWSYRRDMSRGPNNITEYINCYSCDFYLSPTEICFDSPLYLRWHRYTR